MKFNLNWVVKNNELIKTYFFSKFKFDWILDNLHLKEMEALSETVYCKMHNGDRQRGKKKYLYSPFIYSEDNHVTIVASSDFLIKVP